MHTPICRLKEQGYSAGSCSVEVRGKRQLACQATLKHENDHIHRLISAVHLSRPENYLSIYQSGCNFSCRKCHSWEFTKRKMGNWYSPEHVLEKAKTYEKVVTQIEPRNRATAWHAHKSCRCCGSCVMYGRRSSACPDVLNPKSVVLSPQGYGPARNIVAFTGGDIACCPEFYGECARLIKENTKLWVLLETNGYGLTPKNLDYMQRSGVDAFWLDIKAFDAEKHKWLTGCSNKHILKLPEELRRRDFVLEVLSLYIPGVVETEDLEKIAHLISSVDGEIPFTLLAFFPEYRLQKFPNPTAVEMVSAYHKIKAAGLKNVRLGNLGVFVRTEADQRYLIENIDTGAF